MSDAARQIRIADARERFFNAIPEWIYVDDVYVALTAKYRKYALVMQTACNGSQRPDAAGNLIGFRSAAWIARHAGVARSTVWRAISDLEAQGFVVPLAVGGTVRIGNKSVNASNTYGIPGQRGALEHLRVRRQVRRVQVDAQGRRRNVVLQAGEQPTLWHPDLLQPASSDRGSRTIGQGLSHHRTGVVAPSDTNISCPSAVTAPVPHDHGASRAQTSRTAHVCPHITHTRQLMYWQRDPFTGNEHCLAWLYGECRRLGLADSSADGAVRFCTAAVFALRKARRNPAGYFHRLIRGEFVQAGTGRPFPAGDEDLARAMIAKGASAPPPSDDVQAREFGDQP